MNARIGILAVVVALAHLTTFAQEAVASWAGEKPALEKYSYVVVLDNDTTIELTDSAFYRLSRKVIFPVNKHIIPKNSPFRKEIERELMPYMNDRLHVLDHIIIRGAASPEGPFRWNKYLSEQRAKSLYDLVRENSAFPIAEQSQTVQVAEDYVYLLLLMKERGDKDYQAVADIVSEWIDKDQAHLKELLRRYDRGRLWLRLLREYFPALRAARVVLVFRKYHDFAADQPIRPQHEPLAMEAEAIMPPHQAMPALSIERQIHRRELLSVKTNLLFDLAWMPGYKRFCPIPNVAIEFYPRGGHFTFGASFDAPWWQDYNDHKYFQVRNYQLETRYYFKSGDLSNRPRGKGAAFRGWFLQAYVHAGLYNICFDADNGWEGEGAGGGLGAGYVLPLSKRGHWRLELGAQFGYFWTKYDPYQWQCPVDGANCGDKYHYKWTGNADDFTPRQHRFSWFGPTRVSITLSYDLLYRKNGKRGASFRSRER